jgi:hypothetical protein
MTGWTTIEGNHPVELNGKEIGWNEKGVNFLDFFRTGCYYFWLQICTIFQDKRRIPKTTQGPPGKPPGFGGGVASLLTDRMIVVQSHRLGSHEAMGARP